MSLTLATKVTTRNLRVGKNKTFILADKIYNRYTVYDTGYQFVIGVDYTGNKKISVVFLSRRKTQRGERQVSSCLYLLTIGAVGA